MAYTSDYRRFLPGPNHPPTQGIESRTASTHGDLLRSGPPFLVELFAPAFAKLDEPFKGITNDGTLRPALFPLRPNAAPIQAMVQAAQRVLAVATAAEREKISRPLASEQWRRWHNPEFYVFRDTLRLDEHGEELRNAILHVLRASLSPRGYDKAIACMRINHFLGELVNAPRIMNQFSYNFCLFGEPCLSEPWGWQYFGHHLALHCLVIGDAIDRRQLELPDNDN